MKSGIFKHEEGAMAGPKKVCLACGTCSYQDTSRMRVDIVNATGPNFVSAGSIFNAAVIDAIYTGVAPGPKVVFEADLPVDAFGNPRNAPHVIVDGVGFFVKTIVYRNCALNRWEYDFQLYSWDDMTGDWAVAIFFGSPPQLNGFDKQGITGTCSSFSNVYSDLNGNSATVSVLVSSNGCP